MQRETALTLSMRGTPSLVQGLEAIERKYHISRNAAARMALRFASEACPLPWRELASAPTGLAPPDIYVPTTLTLVVQKALFDRVAEDFRREYPEQKRVVASYVFRLVLQFCGDRLDSLGSPVPAPEAGEAGLDFSAMAALLRFLEKPSPEDQSLRNQVLQALIKYKM